MATGREGAAMPALMFDSDQPAVLLGSQCAGARILSYADLATPQLVAAGGGRLGWIDRGLGDPMKVASIADIEPGALSVTAGTARALQWLAEGRPYPTVYHDRNDAAAVSLALGTHPVHRWVATLDGTMRFGQVPADAVQFAGATVLGFHADASVVWNDDWRPLPAAASPAAVAAVKLEMGTLGNVVKALGIAVTALLDDLG